MILVNVSQQNFYSNNSETSIIYSFVEQVVFWALPEVLQVWRDEWFLLTKCNLTEGDRYIKIYLGADFCFCFSSGVWFSAGDLNSLDSKSST